MEVAPGIHRIEAPLGDRFVAMYLLVGDECTMLLDTGLDKMPAQYVAPYLDQIGVPASKIRYVLNSHADFDHTAGNGSAKELAPNAIFEEFLTNRVQANINASRPGLFAGESTRRKATEN